MVAVRFSLFNNGLWFDLTYFCFIGAVLFSVSLHILKKDSKDTSPHALPKRES